MPPRGSSNFCPSLDPIAESISSHHQLDPGKDANQRDADTTPRKLFSCYHANWKWTYPETPYKRYPTSDDLYRLMMADVPTSPRAEVADDHLGPAASLSSSSHNQKAPAAPDSKPAAAPLSVSDAGAEPQADAIADADPNADAPKLDPAGFFTLVSNATTNTTHHPTVKYVFLDDDPDTLTTALAAHHTANQASASRLGGPNKNRAVLLDVVPGPDGNWKVSSAASLSADFAVTDAQISQQEGEKEGGLVLKIDGVEHGAAAAGDKDKDRAESLPSSSSAVAKSGGEEYGPLLEDFERKMNVLRRVVKAGEGRAEKARKSVHEAAKTADVEGEGKGDGQE